MIKVIDRDFRNEVWHTIRSNRRRSIATAFGVFWGILMLVVLLSLGQGIKNAIFGQLKGVGTRTVALFSNLTSKPYDGLKSGRNWDLTRGDIKEIAQKIPEVEYITAPTYAKNFREKIVYRDKSENYSVMGVGDILFKVIPVELVEGRLINDADNENMRKYCMIGLTVKKKLFGGKEDVIGETIKVGSTYYTIVGICKSISKLTVGAKPEESVYVPEVIMKQLNNAGENVDIIMYTVYDGYDIRSVREKINTIIRKNHRIAPDDKSAISEFDISEMYTLMNGILLGITALIWLVGIGTLLSGIVGVTNILLVTVRERTREIGVRRALGAKPRDIIVQLLSEAITLSAVAGITGLVLGVLIMAGVGAITANLDDMKEIIVNPTIPFAVAIVSVVIIIGSGLVGGILPAYRAIQIKAIDAIRDE